MKGFVETSFTKAREALEVFMATPKALDSVERASDWMASGLKAGGKIFSCGNGGSLCDAMHFAEELTGRYGQDRPGLPAMALADPAHLTCVSNDFGPERVFGRFLESWGRPGDILLAISTSGNSLNVVRAVETAKKQGLRSIGLLGKTGGRLRSLVDLPIIVDCPDTARIQEIHIKIIHVIIEGIERSLFPQLFGEESSQN